MDSSREEEKAHHRFCNNVSKVGQNFTETLNKNKRKTLNSLFVCVCVETFV